MPKKDYDMESMSSIHSNTPPDKFILDVAMSISSDSSGKDALKEFREQMAKNSTERRILLSQAGFSEGRDCHIINLQQALRLESEKERATAVNIYTDPECFTNAEVTPNKASRKSSSSVLRSKSTNVIYKRRTSTQKEKTTTDIKAPETLPLTNSSDCENDHFLLEKEKNLGTCNSISINGRSYPLDVPSPWPLLKKSSSAKNHDVSFDSNPIPSEIIHLCESSSSPVDIMSSKQNLIEPDLKVLYDPLPISPFTDAMTTVLLPDSDDESKNNRQLQHSAAIALIEKNKALMKEVRFAEQTCVEVGENNAALAKDLLRVQSESERLKEENQTLNKLLLQANIERAKLEEGHKILMLTVSGKQQEYDRRVQRLEESLQTQQDTEKALRHENSSLQKGNIDLTLEYTKLQEGHNILLSTLEEKNANYRMDVSDKRLEYDRRIQRLEESIQAQQKMERSLRDENSSLQKRNMDLMVDYAKLQEGHTALVSTLEEKDVNHSREVAILQEKLDEVRCLGESLMEGLEESNRVKALLEMELVGIRARHETLLSEYTDSKATRDRLIRRSEIDAKDNISNKNIEVEALKNALIDMQHKHNKKCEEMDVLAEMLKNEKSDVKNIDRSTPHIHSSPTRTILAETLRDELQRNHTKVSRLIELERLQLMGGRSCGICSGHDFGKSVSASQSNLNLIPSFNQEVAVSNLSIATWSDDNPTDATKHQIITPCTKCETFSNDLNCARIRVQELEKDLQTITSFKLQDNERIKQTLQATFESLLDIADSIESQCNQKIDFYSEKIDKISNFIANFQNVCTFVDDYEDDGDEPGTCNDDYDLRAHMRARLASLRSNVQSIQESLGDAEDDIESMFDQHQFLIDEVDNTIQKVRCSPRNNDDTTTNRQDIPCVRDGLPSDGRITVVVNLYTK